MGRVNVTIPDSVEDELKRIAADAGTSASAVAAYGIKAYLDFMAKKDPIPSKVKK